MSNSKNYMLTISPTSRNHSQITMLLTRLTGSSSQARKILRTGGEIPLAFSKAKAEEEAVKFRAMGAIVEIQEAQINHHGFQYSVMLINAGEKKINVIKEVRAVTGLSLSEAKNIVDNGGLVKVVDEEAHANTIKVLLESVGATVEIIITGEQVSSNDNDPIDQSEQDVDTYIYYNLILIFAGEKKVEVIKVVRAIFGLSLAEAKAKVDGLGVIYSTSNLVDVEYFKVQLETAGATVKIETVEEDKVDLVPVEVLEEENLHYSSNGSLKDERGIPLKGIHIQLFDRDIRHLQLLGESTSDKDGNFKIDFFKEDFEDADNNGPDLVFKFFHPNGIPISQFSSDLTGVKIGEDLVFFNVGKKSRFMFTIQSSSLKISEYENLVHQLAPSLGGLSFAELEWEDIIFLHHDTETRIQDIFYVIDDEVVGSDLQLPEGMIYALLVQDIATFKYELADSKGSEYPDSVKRIDKAKLSAISADFLQSKIEYAIQKGIIPTSALIDLDGLKELLNNLQNG